MSGEVLVNWAWLLWLALILIFVVIEVFTLDFTFLMLAVGSLGGLVGGFFAVPFWAQIVIAAALAVVLLFLVRPPLLQAFRRGEDPTPSNVEALLGLSGTALTDFVDDRGQVKLANGDTWTARLADGADAVLEGAKVVVTRIEGATAVVVPRGKDRA